MKTKMHMRVTRTEHYYLAVYTVLLTLIIAKNLSSRFTASTKVWVLYPKKLVKLQRSSTLASLHFAEIPLSFWRHSENITLH